MRIILCGFGVVGQSLVKLFESRSEDLYAKYGLKPRIVGVFDSNGSAIDPSGLDLGKLVEIKKKTGSVKNYSKTKNSMSGSDIIKNIEADVLIETTASNYKGDKVKSKPCYSSHDLRSLRYRISNIFLVCVNAPASRRQK